MTETGVVGLSERDEYVDRLERVDETEGGRVRMGFGADIWSVVMRVK